MQEARAELNILNQKLEVQKKVVAEKQAASNSLLVQVRDGEYSLTGKYGVTNQSEIEIECAAFDIPFQPLSLQIRRKIKQLRKLAPYYCFPCFLRFCCSIGKQQKVKGSEISKKIVSGTECRLYPTNPKSLLNKTSKQCGDVEDEDPTCRMKGCAWVL